MHLDWQSIIALACVAAAAAFLLRRAVRLLAARSGCGSCGGCPSKTAEPEGGAPRSFVPLDRLEHSRRPPR